jgi:cellulose synthase/poly-beta-1,6-N-acetylglucosamine synthase-like glycosyltransferase
MRRAQVTSGRILTIGGVVSAFRTSVLADVGLSDPTMDTEDIEPCRWYPIGYWFIVGCTTLFSVLALLRPNSGPT